MKKYYIDSKKNTLLFRVISILAVLLTVIFNSLKFLDFHNNDSGSLFQLGLIIFNTALVVFWIIIFIFPYRFGISFFVILFYSIEILVLEPENITGIYLYWLAILIMCTKRYFSQHKRVRGTISGLVYLLLIFSEIRFGPRYFFHEIFFEKLANSFILLAILYFFKAFTSDTIFLESLNKKLNIKEYPELNSRDAEWLMLVGKNIKYTAIASEYNISLGALKNRLKVVYEILGCCDRQDFLNKFAGYAIYYGEEYITYKI